ncbi:MAG TPA: protein kinase [Blastocatellia bacterium]|nr:protein kinase [Blastocatellia bacterium]
MYQTISHYRLLEPLGSGGEGQVWKAEDLKLKRIVAIKLLTASQPAGEQANERLRAEAQMAAALSHSNIAAVYELGESDHLAFLVMEWVDGEDLKSIIARGPLDLTCAIDIALQIVEALAAAHKRGLVHCDIKSANIMVTSDALVKVLDFGVARLRSVSNASAARDTLRAHGSIGAEDAPNESGAAVLVREASGTPGYMSPEQLRCAALDERTDIFSLGAVLYEMLTARRPFERETRADVFRATLNDEPPALSSVRDDAPLELESILRRALAKDRNQRYATAEDLRSDLIALKSRLKKSADIERSFYADTTAATATAATGPISPASASPAALLQALAWRHRRGLLVTGALAASLALWAILQSHGANWTAAIGLLAIAAACALGYAAARKRPPISAQPLPAGAAFRGLLPFQEADRTRFYGRETETASLFELIRHGDFRFGVLFGESGCGKTSLLRAGLLPKLWGEGYVPIYCRSYKDPLSAALDECRKRSQIEILEAEPPIEYLRRVAGDLGGTIVLVCDQFEEFFVSHRSLQEREPFLSFLAQCYRDHTLPVKCLVSMRSDFLYLIQAEMGGRIAEPLISSGLYHLRNFEEAHAVEIIERSARRAALPFETGLSRQIARDLSSAGTVSPSELQIVGEQLQSKRIYTLHAYRLAGGKEPLVHSFLEDVIQASGDPEGARLLLRSVISEENTRLTLTLDEIARRTQRSGVAVARLLRLFSDARLIREVQDDDPWRYELMHEYLIDRINQVTGRVMDATQRANRLFRQYLSNYTIDTRTRIPLSKLWFIRRYSDAQRGERERELLRRSLKLGLLKAGALVILLLAGATAAAAALSVTEEWESVRLSDGHTAAVRRAAFSPDGALLVSCGEDKKIIVWDFAKRQRMATLTDHDGIVTAVAFSPDGKWFASASMDKTVIVWDRARLEKVFVLRGHTAGVFDLGFSADGKLLVSIAPEAISWRADTFERVSQIEEPAAANVVFLPQSSKFASTPRNDEMIFIEASAGKTENRKVPGLRSGVIAISPDGKMRLSVDGGGFVQFTDIEHGKVLATFEAHKDNGRSVAFSPDGNLAASASENVILWDTRTQTKIATLEEDSLVWSVCFSPDGRWLVSTHTDGAILVWDVAERQRVANLNEHSGAVYAVGYSRDGKRIASTGEDSSIIIWNAATGQKEAVLIGHKSKSNGVAFLPDGERVVSCGFQEASILWDIARGATLQTFVSPRPDMKGSNGFAVSPDGRWVASSHGVYDIADGRATCLFVDKTKNNNPDDDWLGMSSQVYGLAFSNDGRLLAASTVYQGHIGIVDTESWELVAHTESPDSPFISLSFSPNGEYLAAGDDNGKVELWNVKPLKLLAVMGRHAARVKSVAFSPDGDQVVSSSDDKTIALWNVGSRGLATRIGTHVAPVRSVAFSPDGKHIVSGGHDKSVRVHTRHRILWGYRLD